MGLFNNRNANESAYVGGKKHWVDVIKNSGDGNLLIWRQPEEDFNTNSTLIVMPGVAFDRELHRIGHGGGYYDRYLTAHPEHETIAIAYDFQVLAQVPFEEHDIRPMDLITEKGEYQAG